jgi:uncharacterized protein (TIGR03435 family)
MITRLKAFYIDRFLRVAVLLAFASNVYQISAESQTARAPAFEVVSIKLSKIRGPQGVQVEYLPGGRFSAKAVPIPILIGEAYGVDWRGRVVLSPEFTRSHSEPREQYDIEAVAPNDAIPAGATVAIQKQVLRLMLQSLLSERFKLILRRETQQMPVFAIVVGNNGPKLKAASITAEDCAGKTNTLGDGVSCHSFQAGSGPDVGLHGQAVSISDLAALLSGNIGRPVVDKTGLGGLYSIQTAAFDAELLRALSGDTVPDTPNALSVFNGSRLTLVEVIEQLGLRLESQTAPVERLLIEHLEEPSEN